MDLSLERKPVVERRVSRRARRRRGRRGRVQVPVVLAAGLVVAALAVLWPWVDAQTRAAVVLASVLEVPVASQAAGL
jgi:type VI protein secretion system component VasF